MMNMGPKMRYQKSYCLSTECVYTIWRSEFFVINYKVHVIVVCLFLYFADFFFKWIGMLMIEKLCMYYEERVAPVCWNKVGIIPVNASVIMPFLTGMIFWNQAHCETDI